MLGMVAGGIALEQAIPLGRVWSFPKEIVAGHRFPFIAEALEMTHGVDYSFDSGTGITVCETWYRDAKTKLFLVSRAAINPNGTMTNLGVRTCDRLPFAPTQQFLGMRNSIDDFMSSECVAKPF